MPATVCQEAADGKKAKAEKTRVIFSSGAGVVHGNARGAAINLPRGCECNSQLSVRSALIVSRTPRLDVLQMVSLNALALRLQYGFTAAEDLSTNVPSTSAAVEMTLGAWDQTQFSV